MGDIRGFHICDNRECRVFIYLYFNLGLIQLSYVGQKHLDLRCAELLQPCFLQVAFFVPYLQ